MKTTQTTRPTFKLADDAQEITFNAGDLVIKDGGDYTFKGVVLVKFHKVTSTGFDGPLRYAVQNGEGLIHIFAGKQLKLLVAKADRGLHGNLQPSN